MRARRVPRRCRGRAARPRGRGAAAGRCARARQPTDAEATPASAKAPILPDPRRNPSTPRPRRPPGGGRVSPSRLWTNRRAFVPAGTCPRRAVLGTVPVWTVCYRVGTGAAREHQRGGGDDAHRGRDRDPPRDCDPAAPAERDGDAVSLEDRERPLVWLRRRMYGSQTAASQKSACRSKGSPASDARSTGGLSFATAWTKSPISFQFAARQPPGFHTGSSSPAAAFAARAAMNRRADRRVRGANGERVTPRLPL